MIDSDDAPASHEDAETRAADEAAAQELEATLRALPPRYEPNAVLRWLYRRFFDQIDVDPAWIRSVREASKQGTVVYALRNLSLLDFLALDHITKRFGLPQIRFANDLGLWVLEPFGKGFERAFKARTRDDDLEDLRAAVGRGESAALFLKRPPNLVNPSATGRGLLEGDDFVRELLAIQRARTAAGEKPILVVPQVFVWTKRPDTRQRSIVDLILGTREWPGIVRSAGQFLLNYRNVEMRAGPPLDLAEFLAQVEGSGDQRRSIPPPMSGRAPAGFAAGDPRHDASVRRAVYSLLRRLERERRVIVGPVVKPSDRVIDEIVRSPRMRAVIYELAGEGASERFVVEARARSMLREIAANMEVDVIAAMGTALKQIFERIYDGLDWDSEGLDRVREASRNGTLILLPSHKSHIDYLLISYVFWKIGMQPPLIAAGDNLAFFPLGLLFRNAGAFFIRRKVAGDRLYSTALSAYVHKIVHEGYSLEFFLEGGRSRSGKLLSPKLGLLSMVVDAAFENPARPIYFVPIAIGYERVVEAKSYVRELSGGEKESESVAGLVKAVRVLAERYGRLNLQIGEILTIDRIRADVERGARRRKALARPDAEVEDAFAPRRAVVQRLGHQIIYEINRAMAVTGGSLTAMALLSAQGRGVPRSALLRDCERLLSTLSHLGARIHRDLRAPGGGVSTRAVDEALQLFSSAGWIQVHEGEGDAHKRKAKLPLAIPGLAGKKKSRPRPDDADEGREPVYGLLDDRRMSLALSKNVIVHFFVPYALIATAVRMSRGAPAGVKEVRDRVQRLSRLFKYEFMFRADATYDEIFEETLADLVKQGIVVVRDGTLVAPTAEAEAQLALFASTIASFIEGYRVAARALPQLVRKGPLTQKELVRRALVLGRRMFLAGEVVRKEAVARPVIENAFQSFLDQGYLAKSDGKLVPAESFATTEAIGAVERRIAKNLALDAPETASASATEEAE
jgi:glycerol-3-phosphate O-acyltransferase